MLKKSLDRVRRILHIYKVFISFGLSEWLTFIPGTRPLRWSRFFRFWHRTSQESQGIRLRLALERLGPLFVKFGQLLSTRGDWIPIEIIQELKKLQDQVPPFSGLEACNLIESALKAPIKDLFSEFDNQPLASASIAQVHAARLLTGEYVVVKILRPGITQQVAKDIDLLHLLAKWAKRLPLFQYLQPGEIISEFEFCLQNELNLMHEAANASQLRRNFRDCNLLTIPKIYWFFTRHNVLVMERVYGIPVSDHIRLQQQAVNFQKLAHIIIELFFIQVFRDRFFHADLHPGNIFVAAQDPENLSYWLVDFGIVGTLSPFDQRYLAENLMAFLKRDYQRVAYLHLESGWIPAETKAEAFASAIRTVCEPVFERPLKEISIAQLLLALFQTAKRFQMPIQPQLLLLQKTLFNVEGLSRQLYPDLDLWETARPFLDRWLKEQVGLHAFLRKIRQSAPYWMEKLPDLPELLYQHLKPSKMPYPLQVPITKLPFKLKYFRFTAAITALLLLGGLVLQKLAPHLLYTLSQSTLITGTLSVIGIILLWVSL